MHHISRLGLLIALLGGAFGCEDGGRDDAGQPDGGTSVDADLPDTGGPVDAGDAGERIDAGRMVRAGGLVPAAATATSAAFRLRGHFVPTGGSPVQNDNRRLRGGLIPATR